LSRNAQELDPERAREELDRLRDAIDRVDEVIVRLLNQRARYAIEIGEVKSVLGMEIYLPAREKEVITNAGRVSAGPLDEHAIRRLFERVIDESRRCERESAAAKATSRRNESEE